MDHDARETLEARSRRTGETLTIRVSGNVTQLTWSRGRGRRAVRLADGTSTLDELLATLVSWLPEDR
jgi:hypothetical protein